MEKNEEVAKLFHETYERLAPSFGYETRKASAVPWENVPDNNKKLMIAVVGEVLKFLASPTEDVEKYVRKELGWSDEMAFTIFKESHADLALRLAKELKKCQIGRSRELKAWQPIAEAGIKHPEHLKEFMDAVGNHPEAATKEVVEAYTKLTKD